MTSGQSDTIFGSQEPINYTQYLTFVLRALGYQVNSDFRWDEAYLLSNGIGLTELLNGIEKFLRGDAAVVSLKALTMPRKTGGTIIDDIRETNRLKRFNSIDFNDEGYIKFKNMWELDSSEVIDSVLPNNEETKARVYDMMYKGNVSAEELESLIINNDTYWNYYKLFCIELSEKDCPMTVISFSYPPIDWEMFGRAILTPDSFYIIGWPTKK